MCAYYVTKGRLERVGQEHRDSVSGPQTPLQQGVAEPVGLLVELREAEHLVAVDERRRGAELTSGPPDQVTDLHCCSSPLARTGQVGTQQAGSLTLQVS